MLQSVPMQLLGKQNNSITVVKVKPKQTKHKTKNKNTWQFPRLTSGELAMPLQAKAPGQFSVDSNRSTRGLGSAGCPFLFIYARMKLYSMKVIFPTSQTTARYMAWSWKDANSDAQFITLQVPVQFQTMKTIPNHASHNQGTHFHGIHTTI